MNKGKTVLIIDFEKLTDDEWRDLWKRKVVLYAASIEEGSVDRVTDAVSEIMENEGLIAETEEDYQADKKFWNTK